MHRHQQFDWQARHRQTLRLCAGIAALWGHHMVAPNEAVVKMLDEIGDVSRIDELVPAPKTRMIPSV